MNLRGNIFSVGAIDSEVRIFHGYETPIGTTYNAYLILDEQVTLIDFVKAPFSNVLIDNIQALIGDRTIDNIICNHVEPDHSGALPSIVEKYPNATIYGTANCEKELKAYYPNSHYPFSIVKLGDTLCTGNYHFHFIPMPMVHWPDSMSTYLEEEATLFSNDAFGQHIGTGEIIDTQLDDTLLMDRTADYYANIVLPFSQPVKKLLDTIEGYPVAMICPSHGVTLTEHVSSVLKRYEQWSSSEINEQKVVIIYDTMWGTTRKIAERLDAQWSKQGYQVELISLSQKHYSYAMARILDAKYIFVGSPTLNNMMLPTVIAFLTYMKGLKPRNRIGKAFGSYGWSGESIPQIHDLLSSCGFEMMDSEKAQWNIEMEDLKHV